MLTPNLKSIEWLHFQTMVGNPGWTDGHRDGSSPFLCPLLTSSTGTKKQVSCESSGSFCKIDKKTEFWSIFGLILGQKFCVNQVETFCKIDENLNFDLFWLYLGWKGDQKYTGKCRQYLCRAHMNTGKCRQYLCGAHMNTGKCRQYLCRAHMNTGKCRQYLCGAHMNTGKCRQYLCRAHMNTGKCRQYLCRAHMNTGKCRQYLCRANMNRF